MRKSKQIWEYLMKNDPLITVWSRVCKYVCVYVVVGEWKMIEMERASMLTVPKHNISLHEFLIRYTKSISR